MKLKIDTSKLPEGTTVAEVYETIVSTMRGLITEYEGVEGHSHEKEWAVLRALVDPTKKPTKKLMDLTSEDIAYLRRLSMKTYGVNDWQHEWAADAPVRRKLKRLRLVQIEFLPACGMGDVDTHTCTITKKGREALRQHRAG